MKIHASAIAAILISTTVFGANYFPLSIGNVWYYSVTADLVGKFNMTVSIPSDTTSGGIHYFKTVWVADYLDSSENDTIIRWMYTSGNNVYKVGNLSVPDQKTIIGKLTIAEGDTIYSSEDIIDLAMIASAGGSITVPAGTYASTWKFRGTDSSIGSAATEGPNVTEVTNYYADGTGFIKSIESVNYLGTTITLTEELDSVKLAGNLVIHHFSSRKSSTSICADAKGIKIHSPFNGMSTVSVFEINGRNVANRVVPLNKLVSYNLIGLGMASGQYILSVKGSGCVNLMLPDRK